MVLHICIPNTTCVRSYSVCTHEPVCLLLFKIKMWVVLCILGVVYTEAFYLCILLIYLRLLPLLMKMWVDLCTEASVVYTRERTCVICISCFIYLNQY